jgi:hypothetical protein
MQTLAPPDADETALASAAVVLTVCVQLIGGAEPAPVPGPAPFPPPVLPGLPVPVPP